MVPIRFPTHQAVLQVRMNIYSFHFRVPLSYSPLFDHTGTDFNIKLKRVAEDRKKGVSEISTLLERQRPFLDQHFRKIATARIHERIDRYRKMVLCGVCDCNDEVLVNCHKYKDAFITFVANEDEMKDSVNRGMKISPKYDVRVDQETVDRIVTESLPSEVANLNKALTKALDEIKEEVITESFEMFDAHVSGRVNYAVQ